MEGHATGTATPTRFAAMSIDELRAYRDQGFSARLINESVAPETRAWVSAFVDALIQSIDEQT